MRTFLVSSWLIASLLFTSALSWAAETDADRLLELLVEKKILTGEDASTFRADLAIKKQDEKQPAAVPDWVQNVKLIGDFRNRYRWDKSKSATSPATDRNRDRIRVRLGVDTKVIEGFKVGLGVATGTTTDPKSTDVTLGDGFSFKNIILNYGYGQYTPQWHIPVETTFTAGKFKNPFWEPINAVVDSDINPEGAALQLNYNVNPNANVFLNYGFLYLGDTFPRTKDPLQNVIQPGVNWKINNSVKVKSAVDFWLAEVKGMKQLNNTPGTNTLARSPDQNQRTSDIVYQNDYNSVVPKLEIWFPYFGVFGEYIDNLSPSDKNTGWIAGFKIGNETVADKYQWQLLYDHRVIEKDAFLDIYPDSEFYGGKTNAGGDDVRFNFGLSKNSWITLSYYNTRNLTRLTDESDSSRLPVQTFEADWNIKF